MTAKRTYFILIAILFLTSAGAIAPFISAMPDAKRTLKN